MTAKSPTVSTAAGLVRGVFRGGSAAFYGMPFAEPPVGARRFASPVPHAPWEGVRDATRPGATPQREPLVPDTLIPEPSIPGDSTLNLNVFTPQPGSSDGGLPVLVWIHGGAYLAGSPSSPWYDGAAFNRDGIVTVNTSYRLGLDGFGWIEDAPANRAVRDWLLALAWVQDNIAAFGGDPRRVTVAGQSAGGAAALTLLAVPAARDLFQRAISLSGSIIEVPLQRARELGHELAAALGVPSRRADLARVPEAQLLRAQRIIGPAPGVDAFQSNLASHLQQIASGQALAWAPIIDGDLIPEPRREAEDGGRPLLMGCTDDEFTTYIASHLQPFSNAELQTALPEVHGDHARFISDMLCRAPSWELARRRTATSAPTWLYRFAWPSPALGNAGHCLDVPFFFDCLKAEGVSALTGTEPPQALADEVHGASVRFIRGETPGWPECTATALEVCLYDDPNRSRSPAQAAQADQDPRARTHRV